MGASPATVNLLSDDDVLSAPPSAPSGVPGLLTDEDVGTPAPQLKGAWRLPAMAATNFAQGAARTAAAPGDLGSLAVRGAKALGDWWSPNTGTGDYLAGVVRSVPYVMGSGLFGPAAGLAFGAAVRNLPTTPQIDALGRQMGAFNRPDLQPQTAGENYLAAAARGAGTALPFVFGGGLPSALRTLATGAGSGLGSQAGVDIAPTHPVLGSLFGGLAGGLSANGLAALGEKAINSAEGVGNDMMNAYQTAGVTPRLAGDVTGSPFLQQMQAYAAKTPFGAGRIEDAAHQTLGEFADSTEGIASQLGASRTQQDVGDALQGASAQWIARFRAQSQANWDALDSVMPQDVKVDNYASALDSISKDLAGAPQTARILQPGLSRNLQEALASDTAGSQTLPWQAVKRIRSSIGEMLSDPGLPADTNVAELKRLYSGLTADMKLAAADAGPDAQAAFSDANDFTRNGHQFIDQVIRPAMRQGTSPEQAAASVLRSLNSGGTKIEALRAEMPDAANEVAAYKLRDMASAAAGRQNALGTAVSPSSFLTDWNNLSPEARAALYPSPDVQDRIGALAKISEGIKGTMSKLNTSNTGAHGAFGSLFDIARDTGAGFAAGHLGGNPVLGALGGFAVGAGRPLWGNIAARLTSSPALTAYLSAPTMGALPWYSYAALLGSPAKNEVMYQGQPSGR